MDLKFSVLMSVYKKEKPEYLECALQSIVRQSLMPNEIVVVKDGLLTNELDEIIETFAITYGEIVKIISFATNRGLGLALRDGVLACRNEYIARMDTDDIARTDRFEIQMHYLEQHPEVDLLGSWITEFSTDVDIPDSKTKLPCMHEDILKFAKKRNPFRHMTVVFQKSAVLAAGNYHDCLWFEDYDLWVRMLQHGCKTANIPDYLVNVCADTEMFARRGGWKYLKQELAFQKKLLRSGFLSRNEFITNFLMRSIVRLMPNFLRIWLYRKKLRER